MDPWQGIESFVAVAETASFTKAASRLGISISRVSRDVAQLEARLGTSLLARTTRRVTLTEAGRTLEPRCHQLIDARDAAFAAVAHGPDMMAGHLRLTCAVAFGERSIVPIVNRFVAENRSITVQIILTNHVLDILAEGIDLAVRVGETADVRLRQTPLGSRSLRLIASPAYLEARGIPASVSELADHDCLMGSADYWRFSENGRASELRPRTRWRCNSGFAVLDAALQGLGICQLPDFYVIPYLESGELVELLLDCHPPKQILWAVSQAKTEPQARLRSLIDAIQASLSTGREGSFDLA